MNQNQKRNKDKSKSKKDEKKEEKQKDPKKETKKSGIKKYSKSGIKKDSKKYQETKQESNLENQKEFNKESNLENQKEFIKESNLKNQKEFNKEFNKESKLKNQKEFIKESNLKNQKEFNKEFNKESNLENQKEFNKDSNLKNQKEKEMKKIKKKKNKKLNKKMRKSLEKDFDQLYHSKSDQSKDFSIFVSGKEKKEVEFKVHKSILKCRSPFFEAALNESDTSQMNFRDTTPQSMDAVLKYIYTGNAKFDEQKQDLTGIMKISNKFKLGLLSLILENKIIDSLNSSNVCRVFRESENLDSKKIEEYCLDFIGSNFDKIKKNRTFLVLEEQQLNKIIQEKIKRKEKLEMEMFQIVEDWMIQRVVNFYNNDTINKIEIKRITEKLFSGIHRGFIDDKAFDHLQNSDFFSSNLRKVKEIELGFQEKDMKEKMEENTKKLGLVQQENQNLKSKIKNKEKEKKENQKNIKKLQSELNAIKNEREELKSQLNKKIEILRTEFESKWKKEIEESQLQKQNWEIQKEKMENEIQSMNQMVRDQTYKIDNLESRIEKLKTNSELTENFQGSSIIDNYFYIDTLKEWIQDNNFFNKMRLGFSIKKDTRSNDRLVNKILKKKKTLILVKTTKKNIFGFFTQLGLKSKKKQIKDPKSFLFSLENPKMNLPRKFAFRNRSESHSIYAEENILSFGEDIFISDLEKCSSAKFGMDFSLPEGMKSGTLEAQNYLVSVNEKSEFDIDEIECYFIDK
ncbi:hypothetical protein M0811_05678 [Anaeramoeba ignava]|uniref:BTB domain-containing protein n=1 Tax=Anaeramoeba ignava TaxID=1746090 RepID=A0A9Q0RGB6_ANAIG|nr:hypothetical protein M0811_05678 [Anaeramoeba ignava]